MQKILGKIAKAATLFVMIFSLAFMAPLEQVFAATFTSMSDVLSNSVTGATNVTHTVSFTTATTDNLRQVDFQFSTTSGGTTKPAGLSLGSSTLGTVTGLGGGSWGISTANASTGLLSISQGSATNVNSGTVVSVDLQSITNSDLYDCNTGSTDLNDTCFITITTYSDLGSTTVDSGIITYDVHEDPSLTLDIFAVASGQTHNGITTTVASTDSSLPFGNVGANQVIYVGHKIKVTTNAPHGYTVYAYLSNNITGSYVSGLISPFGAVNATWSTPQLWSTPSGTTANTDTGWFGANTTDTRVSGWASASQKFGPISGIPHAVATSTGSDRSGTDVYVTYALGVNSIQPSDVYTGKIVYDVQASY